MNPINTAVYTCPANNRIIAGKVPLSEKQDMWIIEWSTSGGEKFKSHYLNRKAPFKLTRYKKWFDKAGYKFE